MDLWFALWLYLFLNVNIQSDALISSGNAFQRTLPLYINDRFRADELWLGICTSRDSDNRVSRSWASPLGNGSDQTNLFLTHTIKTENGNVCIWSDRWKRYHFTCIGMNSIPKDYGQWNMWIPNELLACRFVHSKRDFTILSIFMLLLNITTWYWFRSRKTRASPAVS